MTIELAPYQVEARNWLLAHRKGILGDAPGVGKSYPAIAAALDTPPPRLFVCPAYLVGQWQHYIDQMDPSQHTEPVTGTPKRRRRILSSTCDNYIVTYGVLARLSSYPTLSRGWPVVVCDEAHRFRGRNTKATKAGLQLAKQANRWWMLTGTPIYNNAGDLQPLLRMCDSTRFRSYWKFVQEHCDLIVDPWKTVVGAVKDPEAFDQLLSPYMLRRTLEDANLNLKPVLYYDISVKMPPSVLKTMREARKNYLIEHPDMDSPEFLTGAGQLVARLRQMTADPPTRDNPKLSALTQLLMDHPEPAAVYTWYRASRDKVYNALKDKMRPSGRPVHLVPDCDPHTRKLIVDSWVNDSRPNAILVGTIGSMSEGLNLQKAALAVMFEEDWVHATTEQLVARHQRRGQTNLVRVYRIRAARTIDDRVHKVSSQRHANILRALLEDE